MMADRQLIQLAHELCAKHCDCGGGDPACVSRRLEDLTATYREAARLIESGERPDPAELDNPELLVLVGAYARMNGHQSPKLRRLELLLRNGCARGRRLVLSWQRGTITFERMLVSA